MYSKVDKIAKKLHEVAVEKGFWDAVVDYDFLCTKLLLIHSEVTEATEALRKNKGPEELAEEMAEDDEPTDQEIPEDDSTESAESTLGIE